MISNGRLRALTKDNKRGFHDVNSNVLAGKTKQKKVANRK
jgi:hypothetical protein